MKVEMKVVTEVEMHYEVKVAREVVIEVEI